MSTVLPNIANTVAAIATCLLTSLLAAGPVAAAEIVLDLRSGRDFQGEVRWATYDSRGIAWISTKYQLFRAENGRVRMVDSAGDDRRLALAPGGGRYAWLNSRGAVLGQFNFELLALDLPVRTFGYPDAKEFPPGFGSLYFSGQGRLLVAVRPLLDLEGLRGDFGYAFFSGNGTKLAAITRAGLRSAYLDESGEAALLLGESGAESIQKDGKLLWQISGRYQKAVLAEGGNVALLNSSRGRAEVDVSRRGALTQLDMPSPVRNMAITPDGARAAVATDGGRVSMIDISRCTASKCPIRLLPPLPILGVHEITDIRFVDNNTLALGVIVATGVRGGDRYYYGGAIVVITTAGHLAFRQSINIPLPVTRGPQLDVTFGRREFTAFTPSGVMIVSIEP